MKKSILIIGFLIITGAVLAQQNHLLPKPTHYARHDGHLRFGKTIALHYMATDLSPEAVTHLKNSIPKSIDLKVQDDADAQIIRLSLDTNGFKTSEGYRLAVAEDGIAIYGGGEAGLFYGLQSLLQLIEPVDSANTAWQLPYLRVDDEPRFQYRGAMLDVSRHFFRIDQLKHWLDILAYFKINTFHWHLTDDQGWRIEIKKYPELQKVAAFRRETLIGHKKELPHRFDGQRYGGYYTQAQVKELVAYARTKQITVIPEIEMPGHARAALAAYPQLGCTGGPYETAMFWGIFDDVYCAGKEETFQFLEDVLSEVIPLFPGSYIHIGGDECLKDKWRVCPHCQARMHDEHLPDEFALQSYFMQRMATVVNRHGKRIIGWDEILEGGLATDATVMSWTGEEGGIYAAKAGHDAIMSPEKYVYLDYYQSLATEEPLAAGGYTSLEKIYTYDPIPASLTADEAKHIIGVQANLWSEYLTSNDQAEYMLFPRIFALAEIAWTAAGKKDFNAFVNRVQHYYPLLDAAGIHYADVLAEVQDSVAVDGKGMLSVRLKSADPALQIRYRVSHADSEDFLPYTAPIPVSQSCTLVAQTFRGDKPVGRLHTRNLHYSLSTGRPVSLQSATAGNYAVNPQVLTDGKRGTNRYNDGSWLGASGNDLEVVVDLGSVQTVSGLETHFLNYAWQKMWLPTKFHILTSSDGAAYQPVFEGQPQGANGLCTFNVRFNASKARFVKIKAINTAKIPDGYYGAGGKAWLLIDELSIF